MCFHTFFYIKKPRNVGGTRSHSKQPSFSSPPFFCSAYDASHTCSLLSKQTRRSKNYLQCSTKTFRFLPPSRTTCPQYASTKKHFFNLRHTCLSHNTTLEKNRDGPDVIFCLCNKKCLLLFCTHPHRWMDGGKVQLLQVFFLHSFTHCTLVAIEPF